MLGVWPTLIHNYLLKVSLNAKIFIQPILADSEGGSAHNSSGRDAMGGASSWHGRTALAIFALVCNQSASTMYPPSNLPTSAGSAQSWAPLMRARHDHAMCMSSHLCLRFTKWEYQDVVLHHTKQYNIYIYIYIYIRSSAWSALMWSNDNCTELQMLTTPSATKRTIFSHPCMPKWMRLR